MGISVQYAAAICFTAGGILLSGCTKEDPSASAPAASSPQPASPQSAADCDKLPDPISSDVSAAGRAAAVSQGAAARDACKRQFGALDKGNADLARIRQIKEIEQAEREARKTSEEKWRQDVKRGGNAPLKQYTY